MNSESQFITKEKLSKMLPRGCATKVTDNVMQVINNMGDSVGLDQNLLEQELMSYMYLIGGKQGIGVEDLVKAVKYCTLKRHMTNKKAWGIVHPTKLKELNDGGRVVDSFVSQYNGNKLVVAIDTEMAIAVHIGYSGLFHKMIKREADIAMGNLYDIEGNRVKVSAMVMQQATKDLIATLKPPEAMKVDVTSEMGEKTLTVQQNLINQMAYATDIQMRRLQAGEHISTVQKLGISLDVTDVEAE